MNKEKELKARIESEAKAATHITNNGMVCKNCIYRSDKSGTCQKYRVKPRNVIFGGNCEHFQKDNL